MVWTLVWFEIQDCLFVPSKKRDDSKWNPPAFGMCWNRQSLIQRQLVRDGMAISSRPVVCLFSFPRGQQIDPIVTIPGSARLWTLSRLISRYPRSNSGLVASPGFQPRSAQKKQLVESQFCLGVFQICANSMILWLYTVYILYTNIYIYYIYILYIYTIYIYILYCIYIYCIYIYCIYIQYIYIYTVYILYIYIHCIHTVYIYICIPYIIYNIQL